MRLHKTVLAGVAALGVAGGWLTYANVAASAFETRVLAPPVFGSFSRPTGVAVDQATGNVYVADGGGDNIVQVFGPHGEAPVGGGTAQITGAETPSGSFAFNGEPAGIAIDNACYIKKLSGSACTTFDPSDGDIYVPDVQHNVVDQFRLNGGKYEYMRQFTGLGSEPLGVGVDSHGNVYIADYGSAKVFEFNTKAEPVMTLASPLIGIPQYLALDPSGDLYIERFGSSGAVFEVKRNAQGEVEAGGETTFVGGGASGIAYDAARGSLFVGLEGSTVEELDSQGEVLGGFSSGTADFGGVAVAEGANEVYVVSGGVGRYGPPVLQPDVSTGGVSALHRTSATIEGSVNPDGLSAHYYFQYGESEAYESTGPVTETGATVDASLHLVGLKNGTIYFYRLVAENTNGTHYGAGRTFTTPLAVEGVETTAATDIVANGATLNGSLEPNEFDAHYWFEYGAGSLESRTATQDAGGANEARAVAEPIAGLEPNTTYQFLLVAEDTFGVSPGAVQEFTTRPILPVSDGQPSSSNPTSTGVLLHGTIDPEHSDTTYHFEYVEAGSYEPSATNPYAAGGSTEPADAGAGLGDVTIEQVVRGLKSSTTYHYRLVASNPAGIITTTDGTFTTEGSTPPHATTGAAGGVTQNEATIDATVDPAGLPTTYGFEIGTAPGSYGPPTGLGAVGEGASEVAVSLALAGLAPGTTYYYRITATNLDGTADGTGRSFTTGTFANVFVNPPAPLPFVAVPQIAFPPEPKSTTTKSRTKSSTRAQRLARALRVCAKRAASKRAACRRQARRRYGP